MSCQACKYRGWRKGSPDWLGSDPSCAFPEGGPFRSENWNCATMNMLRELAEAEDQAGITRRYFCDSSQSVALVDVYDIDMGGPEDNAMQPGFVLFLTWYKSRGRTDGAWLMSDEGAPSAPTESQALAILRHYKREPHDMKPAPPRAGMRGSADE